MPTADASQFTQFKKLQAAQSNLPGFITRLDKPLIVVTGLRNFLYQPGKSAITNTFNRINVSLGRHGKPKVPGGNLFGAVLGTSPITYLIYDGGTPSASGPVILDGGSPSASGPIILDAGNIGDVAVLIYSGGTPSGGGALILFGGTPVASGPATLNGGI